MRALCMHTCLLTTTQPPPGTLQLYVNRRPVNISELAAFTTPKTAMVLKLTPATSRTFESISIISTLGYMVGVTSDGLDGLYLSIQGTPCDGNTHGFLGDFGCSDTVLDAAYQLPYVPMLRAVYKNGGGGGSQETPQPLKTSSRG